MIKLMILYVFIGGGFALMFVSLQRDADCKMNRVEGFENPFISLYTMYNLMLGNEDPPAWDRLDIVFFYVTYSIVTIILLLNLIIAVMTAVSDTITEGSCKTAMVRGDILEETLSTEANMCLGPWAGWLIRAQGNFAGFHYEKQEVESRVSQYSVQIELDCD